MTRYVICYSEHGADGGLLQVAPACVAVVPGFPGCLQDESYPATAVRLAMYRDPLLTRKWAEQPPAQPQPAAHVTGYGDRFSREHWADTAGALCPAQVELLRPLRLRNTEGRWRVVVNQQHVYTQTVRWQHSQQFGFICLYLVVQG